VKRREEKRRKEKRREEKRREEKRRVAFCFCSTQRRSGSEWPSKYVSSVNSFAGVVSDADVCS